MSLGSHWPLWGLDSMLKRNNDSIMGSLQEPMRWWAWKSLANRSHVASVHSVQSMWVNGFFTSVSASSRKRPGPRSLGHSSRSASLCLGFIYWIHGNEWSFQERRVTQFDFTMGWWGRLETPFSNALSRTWKTKPLFKSDSSLNYHSSLLHTSFIHFHSKLLIVNVINHFAEKGNVTWGIKWSNLQIDLCLAGGLACGLSRICLWVSLAKHAPFSLPHREYIFLGAEYILNM